MADRGTHGKRLHKLSFVYKILLFTFSSTQFETMSVWCTTVNPESEHKTEYGTNLFP